MPVIASGDVTSRARAQAVLATTGAAAVMVGRAAQGNPWALREILDGDAAEPTREEVVAELVLFIRETVRELGERRATGFLKKFYGWYLGRGRFPRPFKQELVQLETLDEVEDAPARGGAGRAMRSGAARAGAARRGRRRRRSTCRSRSTAADERRRSRGPASLDSDRLRRALIDLRELPANASSLVDRARRRTAPSGIVPEPALATAGGRLAADARRSADDRECRPRSSPSAARCRRRSRCWSCAEWDDARGERGRSLFEDVAAPIGARSAGRSSAVAAATRRVRRLRRAPGMRVRPDTRGEPASEPPRSSRSALDGSVEPQRAQP